MQLFSFISTVAVIFGSLRTCFRTRVQKVLCDILVLAKRNRHQWYSFPMQGTNLVCITWDTGDDPIVAASLSNDASLAGILLDHQERNSKLSQHTNSLSDIILICVCVMDPQHMKIWRNSNKNHQQQQLPLHNVLGLWSFHYDSYWSLELYCAYWYEHFNFSTISLKSTSVNDEMKVKSIDFHLKSAGVVWLT